MEATTTEVLFIGILGGFIGKGVDWLQAWFRGKNEKSLTDAKTKADEFEKASGLQREIIADLRKQIPELVALLKELEEERLECRVENATLKAEVKALSEKMNDLEARVKPKPKPHS